MLLYERVSGVNLIGSDMISSDHIKNGGCSSHKAGDVLGDRALDLGLS